MAYQFADTAGSYTQAFTFTPGYFFGALTASRFRPLARRRFSTARPCRVLIRLRNPCSRLRRTLLGWYVRFTATASTGVREKRGT